MDRVNARAIIRQSITSHIKEVSAVSDNEIKNLYHVNGKRRSKSSVHSHLKQHIEKELEFLLLKKYTNKHRFFRFEENIFIYLDMERAYYDMEIEKKAYPDGIVVRARYLDTKNQWLKVEEEFPVFEISTHCLERLIERSRVNSISETYHLISPILDYIIKFCDLVFSDYERHRFPQESFFLYWSEGYMVLRFRKGGIPILITWIPSSWFTDQQFTKFYNFQARIRKEPYIPIIFDSDKLNNKAIASKEDEVMVVDKWWEISPSDILWEKFRRGL
jgi:hypothetical protein